MNLKRRLERIEGKVGEVRPMQLKTLIQGFVDLSVLAGAGEAADALDSDDPRLQLGIDADGEAVVSRWWMVTFLDGTREQRETRLKELRTDLRFQKPWAQAGPPAYFEGGARCDDVYLRLYGKNNRTKEKTNLEYPPIRLLSDQRE